MPEERLAAEEDGDHLLKEASLQALEAAIKALPEGQQVCIQQFYLERNSYRQVAQRTGMPVEQVRSHLQNGRRNLRHILTGHGTKQ
jgi:RNA polymerase sigma-70 factor (ECF subfamily)